MVAVGGGRGDPRRVRRLAGSSGSVSALRIVRGAGVATLRARLFLSGVRRDWG